MSPQALASTAQPRRLAFVLIDGIGDISIPELGNRTPLEAADTPHLDRIAGAGWNGLLDPVEPGLACGSDTAHLSILGYDPRRCAQHHVSLVRPVWRYNSSTDVSVMHGRLQAVNCDCKCTTGMYISCT